MTRITASPSGRDRSPVVLPSPAAAVAAKRASAGETASRWPSRDVEGDPIAGDAPADMTTLMSAIAGTRLVSGLIAAAIIIAGLYYGREVLLPLALAILLGFVLDPIVTRLKRFGLPRVAAVATVMTVTLALVIALGVFVFAQMRTLATELPIYQWNVTEKIRNFRQTMDEPGPFDGLRRLFGRMQSELESVGQDRQAPGPGSKNAPKPLERVEVVPVPPSAWQRGAEWLGSITTPLVSGGITLLFVVLILLDRGDLRDRALRLLGGNLHRTTDAIADASRRVSRYLTMQLVVNVTYGIPLALGLWLIGVPGALLWGLLAAVMRFVPFIGPVIAAVFPTALAFATDPGWEMVFWTVGLVVLLETVSNNVIEPWLYGTSTGMSSLSVVLSMTFWTAIWGPLGLVLSVPVTVVLLVLGRHLPQLQVLDILLGSEPVLDTPTRLYQRLLAGDFEEAAELAVEQSAQTSPQAFYESAGIPALRLATMAHATVATAEHRHRLVSGMEQVIDELREQYPVGPEASPDVVCFGGRWLVDALAADMTAHALSLAGHPARLAPTGNISSNYIARLDLEGANVVCLTYFSPDPATHARYFVRRLRQRWPDLHVVIVLWNASHLFGDEAFRENVGAQAVVGSLDEVGALVQQYVAGAASASFQPAPIPEKDLERVAALRASGILDEAMRSTLDGFAKRAADAFDSPIARITLIDDEDQWVHGDSRNDGSAAAPVRDAPRSESVCGHVVAEGRSLVVPDITRDPRFASNPMLKSRGIRFYAGAPLRIGDSVLGTLCLLDTRPRNLTPRDVLLLEAIAEEVVSAVMRRQERLEEAPARVATPAGDGGDDPVADPVADIDSGIGRAHGVGPLGPSGQGSPA